MTNERAILRLEMLYENCQEEMCEGACVYCLDAIKKATESLQREPKRGKWIDVSGRGSWSVKNACNQCGEIVFQPNYNYCPNCGAKMEE